MAIWLGSVNFKCKTLYFLYTIIPLLPLPNTTGCVENLIVKNILISYK